MDSQDAWEQPAHKDQEDDQDHQDQKDLQETQDQLDPWDPPPPVVTRKDPTQKQPDSVSL